MPPAPKPANQPRYASPYGGTASKVPPDEELQFPCPVDGCPWSFPRDQDLKRHSVQHLTSEEREAKKVHCPYAECPFKTLQASNLATHIRAKHTGEKPHQCSECSYTASDHSCLNRHRKNHHNYNPPRLRKSRARSAVKIETLASDMPVLSSRSSSVASSAYSGPDPGSSSLRKVENRPPYSSSHPVPSQSSGYTVHVHGAPSSYYARSGAPSMSMSSQQRPGYTNALHMLADVSMSIPRAGPVPTPTPFPAFESEYWHVGTGTGNVNRTPGPIANQLPDRDSATSRFDADLDLDLAMRVPPPTTALRTTMPIHTNRGASSALTRNTPSVSLPDPFPARSPTAGDWSAY
ncbi:hypothetical protein C8F01DRAFT_1148186 [Mycena amicta]|nr:hypothetical protein C8F01DRAFT_1148186 [Mycena amicta]